MLPGTPHKGPEQVADQLVIAKRPAGVASYEAHGLELQDVDGGVRPSASYESLARKL